MAEVELDGVVQADETYSTVSYKGHHKSFILNCHAPLISEERERLSVAYPESSYVFLVV